MKVIENPTGTTTLLNVTWLWNLTFYRKAEVIATQTEKTELLFF